MDKLSNFPRRFRWVARLLFAIVVGTALSAHAATCVFTGASGGLWDTASNWSGCNSTVPQQADTVQVSGGKTVILGPAPYPISNLRLDGKLQGTSLSGTTLSIQNASGDLAFTGPLTFKDITVNLAIGNGGASIAPPLNLDGARFILFNSNPLTVKTLNLVAAGTFPSTFTVGAPSSPGVLAFSPAGNVSVDATSSFENGDGSCVSQLCNGFVYVLADLTINGQFRNRGQFALSDGAVLTLATPALFTTFATSEIVGSHVLSTNSTIATGNANFTVASGRLAGNLTFNMGSGTLFNSGANLHLFHNDAFVVNGNYNQSAGTILLGIDSPTSFGKISVSGNATINASSMQIQHDYDYAGLNGRTFDVVQVNGTLTTTLTGVNSAPFSYAWSQLIEPNRIRITETDGPTLCTFLPLEGGDWGTAANWGGSCNGTRIPTSTDRVDITQSQTVNINVPIASADALNLVGATLNGAGSSATTLNIGGQPYQYYAASVWGSGGEAPSMQFSGLTVNILGGHHVHTFASLTLTDAVLSTSSSASIYPCADMSVSGANARVINAGVFSACGNVSNINIDLIDGARFDNTGDFSLLGASVSITGVFDNKGRFFLSSSTVTLVTPELFTQSDPLAAIVGPGTLGGPDGTGVLTLAQGSVEFDSNSGDEFYFNFAGVVNSGAVIQLSDGGFFNTINISGYYQQGADGRLELDWLAVPATGQPPQFDKLIINGFSSASSFGGLVRIHLVGDAPAEGVDFKPILHPNSTPIGTFSSVDFSPRLVSTAYQSDGVKFTASAAPPTITSSAPPSGTFGTAYSHTFTAIGTTPITWSITSGTAPAGLSLDAMTGVLSGTPSSVGTFNFTLQAANGTLPNATQPVTLTINKANQSSLLLQSGPPNATAAEAGESHSCALVDGGVQCWGANFNGQLGNNSTTNSLVPVQAIAPGSNVTALEASSNHNCAVINGGVQCWGDNRNGRLGNDSTTQSPVPVQVSGLTSSATAVSAGGLHSCAVVNGGVRCWGAGSNGQLGNGSATQSLVPVQVSGLTSDVTAVAAGGLHSCAVVNGGVRCWGAGSNGQLGNGSVTQSSVPVQVSGLTSDVTAVAAGGNHSCAVVNGGVRCWGFNSFGTLGNGTTTPSTVPVQVSGLTSNVTAVAASTGHSCAVVDGGVQCWGANSDGQLGANGTTNSPVPVQAIVAGSNVTAVSTVFRTTCAVVNGAVKCWGRNSNGQLGNGNTTNSLVPVNANLLAATSATLSVNATLTLNATGGSGTGPITLASDNTLVCTVSGLVVTAVGAGTCQVTATRAADANYNAATSAGFSIIVTGGATGPFAYITNFGSNTLSVIDTNSNIVVGTVTVGSQPYGVAVNGNASRVYVTSQSSNSVLVINTATNTVMNTIAVGPNPYGVTGVDALSRAYVANYSGSSVSVINTTTNAVITTIPVGNGPIEVAASPTGNRLYVTNGLSNSVSVIDTATNAVLATLPVGVAPYGAVVNPAGTRVYVSNDTDGSVSVIDAQTNAVINTITVGARPLGVAINAAGSRLYVANYQSSSVSVIDTSTNGVIATISLASTPRGLSLTPNGQRLYLTYYLNADGVVVIDTSNNSVLQTVAVGSAPVSQGQFIVPPPKTLTAPTVTTTSLPNGVVGSSYNQTVAATGTGPFDWSISANLLPPGLSLNATTGVISGTPSAVGTFSFTLQAANGVLPNATQNVTMTIVAAAVAPTITFATTPSSILVNGASVGTLTVSNSNGTPLTGNAFTFNYLPGLVNAPTPNASSTCVGATPTATPGAALSATTTSFTIPANGSCTFSVTLTSAAEGVYSGIIPADLIMTSAGGSNATPLSLTVTAVPVACAPGNYSVTGTTPCTAAAAGHFVSTTGATTQTACSPGAFSASTGASACTPAPLGRFVAGSTATASVPCAIGSFSSVLGATSCAQAPAGSFVSATGAASATPCAAGSYQPATGQASCILASANFFVAASGATAQIPCPQGQTSSPGASACGVGTAPIITSTTPASGLTSTDYRFTFTASGTAPITWSIVGGSLPPGLVLNGLTGVISGTPTTAGSFTFTIRATNAAGQANLATGIAVAVPIISVISLSANDLNFGNQNVGTTSAAQIVTVGNTGNGPFNVNSVTGIGDFGFASNCTTVVPGAACSITATFSPLTVGPLSGRISVNSTAQGGDSGISLSGTGVVVPRPNLIINPGSMIFGDQAIGSASASQIVFFSNTGQLSLILSDIRLTGSNSAGFSLTNPPTANNPRNHPMCSTANNVAPGASCALGVVFGPTTLGGNLASISVTHNATPTGATGTSSVGLNGNATQRRDPIIRVSAGLSFGEQIVDTSSIAQGVTVTNAGTADLTIGGFGVESRNINTLPIDFAVAPPTSVTGNGCTAGSRLVPNASCALNITFTPTLASTLGDKSAALMIASNAVNVTSSDTRAASVSLIGTAIAEPTPLLRLSATSIGFGTVIFPTGTESRQLTLTNAGTRPLIISATGITINLGDYQQTNTCSGGLAPAQSCVVTIVFTPQELRARDATLTIVSNAPGSPNRVTLTGNGCALIPPTARRSFIGTSCAD